MTTTATPDGGLVIDHTVDKADVAKLVAGYETVTIDCGVMTMSGEDVNDIMKTARAVGATRFVLRNVCGQTLIGTGVPGPVTIDVHGLMGNHSAAFVDRATINTYDTTFPNGVRGPGDAQVAIGNTGNPVAINVGGSVDDLFAAYTPSGMFRVAGQGGNRCGLRGGAGVPAVWRKIPYDRYEAMDDGERIEEMLYLYQKRRARIMNVGWEAYLGEFREHVENRQPPVIVFGRRVRDYFLEYAQGTVGVILNLMDIDRPCGYYVCSGMTAGRAYIRGALGEDQLGERVKFAPLEQEDHDFLKEQVVGFHETFTGRMDDAYQQRLDWLRDEYEKNPDGLTYQFNKIVPA
jgi:glutamate synthase domain-containing protein 3